MLPVPSWTTRSGRGDAHRGPSPFRAYTRAVRLPRHHIYDVQEEKLIEFLLLGVCWLLISLPVSVLLGRCIAVGQAGESERHAAEVVRRVSPEPFAAEAHSGTSTAVPAQRQAAVDAHLVS